MEDFSIYERTDLTVEGRGGYYYSPKNPLPGNPWVYRTEFFGAFAQADLDLIKRGWHVAYYGISDMFGCPEAVELMHAFWTEMTEKHGMSKNPVLFGFSRGGMYAVNFGAKYPECVGGLYIDAPVLDMRSWPGGAGVGCGSGYDWDMCADWYHLDKKTTLDECRGKAPTEWKPLPGNPLENAETVAQNGTPVLLVAGDSDSAVPFVENGEIFVKRVSDAGGDIDCIVKPGCDHHPHSLTDTLPIVRFCERIIGIKK